MLTLASYDYALLRVVPRVDRGECMNAGVILFCRTRRFLGAQVALIEAKLRALDPECDVELVSRHLDHVLLICAGGAAGGPIGELPLFERFHWLVAPRSTIIQTSPVHSGLCADPAAMLETLLARTVT